MTAERITVEMVTGGSGTPSIIVTEENTRGGLVWQRGLSIDQARAVHRALGVALAQVPA